MFTYVYFEVYIYNWFVMVALYVVVILQCIMSGKCVYGCWWMSLQHTVHAAAALNAYLWRVCLGFTSCHAVAAVQWCAALCCVIRTSSRKRIPKFQKKNKCKAWVVFSKTTSKNRKPAGCLLVKPSCEVCCVACIPQPSCQTDPQHLCFTLNTKP